MPNTIGRRQLLQWGALALAFPAAAQAQKKYDRGASDAEIKIGNFAPYSGPASAYGTLAKANAAYFAKLNAAGGINGRKINFISLDDAYNPAQSVEQTRKLVERDGVLLLFAAVGTSHNLAVRNYLHQRKVPNLFLSTGSPRLGDKVKYPWTLGFRSSYHTEGETMARHIMAADPNAKVGILVQNDDFGKDYLQGFLQGFGDRAKQLIVSQQSYELSDPTADSQMVALKNSGANVFVNISTPKFAAQAIRKMAEIGWNAAHYVASVSQSIQSVLKPAGLDNAKGIMTVGYLIDPSDPKYAASEAVAQYLQFMQQYYPAGDPNDSLNVIGYSQAQALEHVLAQCGDDLTRENIMRQTERLDLELPMLMPGIKLQTAPGDFYPVKKVRMLRFDGSHYAVID